MPSHTHTQSTKRLTSHTHPPTGGQSLPVGDDAAHPRPTRAAPPYLATANHGGRCSSQSHRAKPRPPQDLAGPTQREEVSPLAAQGEARPPLCVCLSGRRGAPRARGLAGWGQAAGLGGWRRRARRARRAPSISAAAVRGRGGAGPDRTTSPAPAPASPSSSSPTGVVAHRRNSFNSAPANAAQHTEEQQRGPADRLAIPHTPPPRPGGAASRVRPTRVRCGRIEPRAGGPCASPHGPASHHSAAQQSTQLP